MPDRWILPAWTGPDSPQTPVRIPSREEVNQMTDETQGFEPEATEEAEPETAETAEEATEAESDSPE